MPRTPSLSWAGACIHLSCAVTVGSVALELHVRTFAATEAFYDSAPLVLESLQRCFLVEARQGVQDGRRSGNGALRGGARGRAGAVHHDGYAHCACCAQGHRCTGLLGNVLCRCAVCRASRLDVLLGKRDPSSAKLYWPHRFPAALPRLLSPFQNEGWQYLCARNGDLVLDQLLDRHCKFLYPFLARIVLDYFSPSQSRALTPAQVQACVMACQ